MTTLAFLKTGLWTKRHHLDKMTFRELVIAYVQYYAIQAYVVLAALTAWGSIKLSHEPVRPLVAVAVTTVIYPLVWYLLHRFVLHSRWMFKSRLTARTWKRIHYDHHQDPHHLEVLFGALYTTLPTIILATAPVGYAIGGWGSASAAVSAGLLTTCFYEFCHCVQHLSYKPKARFLAAMKARHMAHHFHDESGNYGITNFFWDKLLGTFYEREDRPTKSPTVFNLGYTIDEATRYPWVAELTGDVPMTHPRDRRTSTR